MEDREVEMVMMMMARRMIRDVVAVAAALFGTSFIRE